MAAAMAAKINAMLMAKGKLMTPPPPLLAKGKSQEQVNKAVLRIKEIISEDVLRSALSVGQQFPVFPPLTLYPQPPRPAIPSAMPRLSNPSSAQGHRPAAPHSGSFVHIKIFVGLDQALPSFNVNEKVEGPGGTYLGHIQTETGARVFLRGKTSGYIEQASKRESFEPLYVYISHPNSTGLEAAKKLTESLLETVRAEHSRMVSIYTATGSTQPYAAQGFPPNSTSSSQGSWCSYPANGYAAGGYTAYPGAAGCWSSSNGPPSHSNLSTNPQSSQAMVQYPVCPRKPHPYLVQDRGSRDGVEPEESPGRAPDAGSPKRRFQEEEEEPRDQEPTSGPTEAPAKVEAPPPASSVVEKGAERALMPPPPPLFAAPLPVARKRPREPSAAATPPAPLPTNATPIGTTLLRFLAHPAVAQVVWRRSPKLVEDSSGLVPYGGDSSDEDEEEEGTHGSNS
ncbi:hypothetical protein CRUP_019462 [Coryphaenoides rupestris]|nr:hypothetical protein CRUP_019462 [Coryphaenoides rupestris]